MALKFDDLADEYADLFARVTIKPSWLPAVDHMAQKILDNKVRYRIIEDSTGCPWYWIGALHALESGCRFSTHLHNGDPLTSRTKRIPRGRPLRGSPPFSWEESAIDALMLKGLQNVADWSLPRMLYEAERYNGWGYRLYHREVLSPYLWSGTALYRRGKYVSDGKWSSSAVSQQAGIAPLLYRLAELDQTVELHVPATAAESYAEADEVIEGGNPPHVDLPVPESFPKADEPRVTEAVRKSRTITGAIFAFFGMAIEWGKEGIEILLDAGSQVVEWSPAQSVLTGLGANLQTVAIGLTLFGLVLVVSRRLNAAARGKIG